MSEMNLFFKSCSLLFCLFLSNLFHFFHLQHRQQTKINRTHTNQRWVHKCKMTRMRSLLHPSFNSIWEKLLETRCGGTKSMSWEISPMVWLCQKHLTHTKGSVSRIKFTTGENYLSLGNQLCNFSGPPLICLPVSFFITLMLLQMQWEAAEFSD